MTSRLDKPTERGETEMAKPLVLMKEYKIHQKTSGPRTETAPSTIEVVFEMFSDDTHSIKHEEFLSEIREFLNRRNSQSQKETAKMAEIKAAIEQGKMTLNEARITVGLEPLDNHVANVLFKRKG